MDVAIMGAGLSGLTCAIQLEKQGIIPTIFEKRSMVGDRFVNGEVLLSIFSRPVRDDIAYLSEKYQIYLHPTGNISEFVVHSANEKAVLQGNFGFSNLRGRHKNSFESQLARQVKSKIHYHSEHTYEQLVRDFSHVVVATGDAEYAMVVKNFNLDITVTLKGATVEGNFSRYGVMAWFDEYFAPKGYGYLIPYSDREANITITFPEKKDAAEYPRNDMWNRFYERICTDLQQNLRITDQFEVNNYVIGECISPRIGNSLFTGNCFGSIMPFFGFGQFPSILSGIYAADDLCGNSSYLESTKELRRSYRHSLIMRSVFESMDESAHDFMVRSLNGRLGQKLLTTRIDVLKYAAKLLKLGKLDRGK